MRVRMQRARQRGAVLVGLAVVTASLGAAPALGAAAPAVVFDGSSSKVSYSLVAPPDGTAVDAATGSGRRSSEELAGVSSDGNNRASASTAQTTTTKHGPVAGGYTVRTIRSVAALTGAAKLSGDLGATVVAEASATSVTRFTVDQVVSFSFLRQTVVDNDVTGCTKAVTTLRRGDSVVLRRTSQTSGCGSAPVDMGDPGGNLSPGRYTLETLVTGKARATDEYNTGWTARMSAESDAVLRLGSGKICTNVLPGPGGKTIIGTAGNDVLCGSTGADVLEGNGGNDVLVGKGGGDTLRGGAGADDLDPGSGRDVANAGGGDDTMRGCDGTKDRLSGAAGTDTVYRDGADVLAGFERSFGC